MLEQPTSLQQNVSLKEHTTLGIGGCAEYYISCTDTATLRSAVLWAKAKGLPITILGGGSNVLIDDKGVSGLVLSIAISEEYVEKYGTDIFVTAGAGIPLDSCVAECVQSGIWGLENLSAIPGSIGGAPVQNVGAYGVEMSDMVVSVVAYDIETDAFVVFSKDECDFQYRHSFFKSEKGRRYVIVWITFKLSLTENPQLGYNDLTRFFNNKEAPTLQEIRSAVIETRSKKFPDWSQVGTAGSFFKNPIVSKEKYASLRKKYPELPGFHMKDGRIKIPLGWVLDRILQVKGVQEGAVGMYMEQALVLVNYGDASSKEVIAFAESITNKIGECMGITIEWEVQRL